MSCLQLVTGRHETFSFVKNFESWSRFVKAFCNSAGITVMSETEIREKTKTETDDEGNTRIETEVEEKKKDD